MAVTAMPGQQVPVSAVPCHEASSVRIHTPTDSTTWAPGDAAWTFEAPDAPGLYPLTVRNADDDTVQLQVFVLKPWDHRGTRLAGYRIGRYRAEPRRGLEVYERPEGFIEVTADVLGTQVSPNFKLDQFLSKQTQDTPEYIMLDTRLLHLLEAVLAEVRDRGHDAETLQFISAFRTPYYNRSIGNTTSYSRHLYGDAADIFVDTTGDGRLDDLNGDGRVTRADAQWLADLISEVKERHGYEGGIGIYGPAPHRGPFVHVDMRGQNVRW